MRTTVAAKKMNKLKDKVHDGETTRKLNHNGTEKITKAENNVNIAARSTKEKTGIKREMVDKPALMIGI